MKQRLDTLDICKGIAMILVTTAHILGSIPTPPPEIIVLMRICYAVELPIFFMACGIQFQYNNTERKTPKNFFCGRVKRILYPYFTFSIIYALIDIAIFILKYLLKGVFVWRNLTGGILEAVFLWGRGPLWFLPALLGAECLFYVVNKFWSQGLHVVSVLILIISNLFSGITEPYYESFLDSSAPIRIYLLVFVLRILVAYSYVYIGSLLLPLIKSIIGLKQSVYKSVGGMLLVCMGCAGAQLSTDMLDLHFGYTRNPFITYPVAIILFLGIFMLFDGYKMDALKRISQNSIFLMGMQFLTGYIVIAILTVLNRFNMSINACGVGITAIALFWIVVIPCAYVQKNYMNFIIEPPLKRGE